MKLASSPALGLVRGIIRTMILFLSAYLLANSRFDLKFRTSTPFNFSYVTTRSSQGTPGLGGCYSKFGTMFLVLTELKLCVLTVECDGKKKRRVGLDLKRI